MAIAPLGLSSHTLLSYSNVADPRSSMNRWKWLSQLRTNYLRLVVSSLSGTGQVEVIVRQGLAYEEWQALGT